MCEKSGHMRIYTQPSHLSLLSTAHEEVYVPLLPNPPPKHMCMCVCETDREREMGLLRDWPTREELLSVSRHLAAARVNILHWAIPGAAGDWDAQRLGRQEHTRLARCHCHVGLHQSLQDSLGLPVCDQHPQSEGCWQTQTSSGKESDPTSKLCMSTSLMVQWIRICLPMQGTQVRSLIQEDPPCRGTVKPVCNSYWAQVPTAWVLQQEKPLTWEACSVQWRAVSTRHD